MTHRPHGQRCRSERRPTSTPTCVCGNRPNERWVWPRSAGEHEQRCHRPGQERTRVQLAPTEAPFVGAPRATCFPDETSTAKHNPGVPTAATTHRGFRGSIQVYATSRSAILSWQLPLHAHALQSDPRKGHNNPISSDECTLETAGDLRLASDAASIRNRQFENAKSSARDPHLHFEVPAVGQLVHPEFEQGVPADRAEGTHVGEAHPVQEPDQPTGHKSRRQLMEGDTPRLPLTACTRSDD